MTQYLRRDNTFSWKATFVNEADLSFLINMLTELWEEDYVGGQVFFPPFFHSFICILMFGLFRFDSQRQAVGVTEVNAEGKDEIIILICFCYELC